jgi:hypothetical protein
MLFVLLSHFTGTYFGEGAAIAPLLRTICMVASPGFMLISGMMLGFLYRRDRHDFGRIRLHLFDKALFLLTAGHLIIWLAHFLRLPDAHSLLRYSFITDSVAISVLLVSVTITGMRMRTRAVAGLGVYVLSWLLVLTWQPHVPSIELIKDTFVGAYGRPSAWLYNVPLLPWLGLYLVGTVLGERLGVLNACGDRDRFAREVFRLGVVAVTMSLVLKLAFQVIRSLLIVTHARTLEALRATASMAYKLPPSPAYMLLFGGSALMIFGIVLSLDERPLFDPFMRWTALLGRNSLFVFLVQYYVYIVALEYFRLPVITLWPVLFAGTVVLITLAARAWDRGGFNDYLSVRHAARSLRMPILSGLPKRALRAVGVL